MTQLRDYQELAVRSVLDSVNAGKNPIVSLPTGSGKSLVAAAIAAERPGRTLLLSHRKELLRQDMDALARYAPDIDAGIYSAGLGMRDTTNHVIFAGVASVYKRMEELGKFSTVLIDEAHLISPIDEGVLYNSCLEHLNGIPRVGLTATPYRLDSGLLHEGEGAWFNDMPIHIKPSELVQQGYLCQLVGIGALTRMETEGAHIRGNEFVSSDLSQLATDQLVEQALSEMQDLAEDRQHGLIFAIDVAHAEQIERILRKRFDEYPEVITGKTESRIRDDAIMRFKNGEIRWLINVNVLTTGFDAPDIDCLTILRPTLSKGLHVQMLGRGMRLAPGKKNCLVLDFSGNVARHGNLDMLTIFTERKSAEQREKEKGVREARERQIRHAMKAATDDPMTGSSGKEVRVYDCKYKLTASSKHVGLLNVMVSYETDIGIIRQWICPEYSGGARWHAEQWFKRRGDTAPRTAGESIKRIRNLPKPDSLSVNLAGRFPEILIEHFDTSTIDTKEIA